ALLRVDEPCDANTQEVQSHHGSRENAHAADIRRRGEGTSNDENHQNAITDVSPHPSCADNPHQGQEKNENWHFKYQAQPKDYGKEKIRVLVDIDQWGELRPHLADQKVQRRRIDNPVSEVAPSREKQNRRNHEWNGITFFFAIQAWRDKKPDLV